MNAAGSLIVAPRLPAKPTARTGNPFKDAGDVVADCAHPGCTYHAMGPRDLVKKALDDHIRQHHSEQGAVILLNHPSQ